MCPGLEVPMTHRARLRIGAANVPAGQAGPAYPLDRTGGRGRRVRRSSERLRRRGGRPAPVSQAQAHKARPAAEGSQAHAARRRPVRVDIHGVSQPAYVVTRVVHSAERRAAPYGGGGPQGRHRGPPEHDQRGENERWNAGAAGDRDEGRRRRRKAEPAPGKDSEHRRGAREEHGVDELEEHHVRRKRRTDAPEQREQQRIARAGSASRAARRAD